jgi:hypothetical protein
MKVSSVFYPMQGTTFGNPKIDQINGFIFNI